MKIGELRELIKDLPDYGDVLITQWCTKCTARCEHDLYLDTIDAERDQEFNLIINPPVSDS